jgi:hypothetical protein
MVRLIIGTKLDRLDPPPNLGELADNGKLLTIANCRSLHGPAWLGGGFVIGRPAAMAGRSVGGDVTAFERPGGPMGPSEATLERGRWQPMLPVNGGSASTGGAPRSIRERSIAN